MKKLLSPIITIVVLILICTGAVSADGTSSEKWFDKDCTQKISDSIYKYTDEGIGFKICFPVKWGKPQIGTDEKYDFPYTKFYESKDIKLITYGNFLENTSSPYEDYLASYGFTYDKRNILKINNSTLAYIGATDKDNSRTIKIIAFKDREAFNLELNIADINTSEAVEFLGLFREILKSLELTPGVG